MRNPILYAAFVTLVVMGGNAHAEEDGLDIVKREFLGIMKEHGWKDTRIGLLTGSEELFEIRDFTASRPGTDGKPEVIKIGVLTVDKLSPEERWTRAESLRAENVKIVVGGNEIDLGVIYSKKPGILDVDSSSPSLEFENLILSKALWVRGGVSFADIEQMYLSADNWVGGYGVPGRLDATVKGSVAMPGASGGVLLPGEFALKTNVSASRDELSVVAAYKMPGASWTASATLNNFDRNLFRTWFDRNNPEAERTPEDEKALEEAFAKEVGEVGLTKFEVKGNGDGQVVDPLFATASTVAQLWLPKVAGGSTEALLNLFKIYAAKPEAFGVSGYARDGVPVVDILHGKESPMSRFRYTVAR
jgi:hypothetical protein